MKKHIKNYIYIIILVPIILIFSYYLKNLLNEKIINNFSNSNEISEKIQEKRNIDLTEAYVTKVIDGDTIWVKIDGTSYKVRLIGINCPEYTKEIEPYGKEATQYTYDKLYHKTVYLQKDITDKDQYGRLLRYVWLDKIDVINEENIKNLLFNYDLVINGFAYSNYYNPNISLQSYLEEAEKYAKDNSIGLWQ